MAHVFLPLSLFVQLWSGRHDLPLWCATMFFLVSYMTFVSVAGVWSWFGFVYRAALPILLLPTVVLTWPGSTPTSSGLEATPQVIVGLLFLWLTFRALRGRRAPANPLDLTFPLRGGTFVVGQGGDSAVINYHHPHPAQRYALDILALGANGTRARGLYPRDPARYAIWGAEVVSPCDGVVAAAADGLPDLSPPARDPSRPPGNHVAILTQNTVIVLAHLKQGSVRVTVGEQVRAGQPIGLVGNSGNSTEPHLHIHAESPAGTGAPITFGGRFLVRNDRVKAPRTEPVPAR